MNDKEKMNNQMDNKKVSSQMNNKRITGWMDSERVNDGAGRKWVNSRVNGRMNSKGVLFTFFTFLLIGLLLGLVVYTVEKERESNTTTVEIAVLNSINAKYDDITDDIITLDHPIGVPSISQRIIPFNHQVDGNSITFTQQLPIETGKLSLYYDLINAYQIFITDENFGTTFDGITVDMSVPKPPGWGGASQPAHFNILPPCIQYQITDSNTVQLENTSTMGCQNEFAFGSIKQIDINIFLQSALEDYNMVSCSTGGGCPHQDYNQELTLPFFQLFLFDENCVSCNLSQEDKNISFHFPSTWNTIEYSCGGECQSPPLTIELGEGIRLLKEGFPSTIEMKITFNEVIETFYYQDANYTVSKKGFSTKKSNIVVFPK